MSGLILLVCWIAPRSRYASGVIAGLFIILWWLSGPASIVVALVSVGMSPFARRAGQALRLARLGFDAGLFALLAGCNAMLILVNDPTGASEFLGGKAPLDEMLLVTGITALPILLSLAAQRICRQHLKRQANESMA